MTGSSPGRDSLRPRRGSGLVRPSTTGARRSIPRGAEPQVSELSTAATVELPRILKISAAIIAPATLITALLFYFGANHAYWYFNYFGVNYTALDLTTTDFLLRSADALFLPIVVVAGAATLAVWLYRYTADRLNTGAVIFLRKLIFWLSAIFGILGISIAIIAWKYPKPFSDVIALPGVCLALAVPLLAVASRLQRERSGLPRVAPWVGIFEAGVCFLLTSVGLFWAATNYAAVVGSTRALRTEQGLNGQPQAILYSERALSIPAVSAREVVCQRVDSAYRYRYDGLRLVFASADEYFLLPADWPDGGGIAIVIPRSAALRLEFAASNRDQSDSC